MQEVRLTPTSFIVLGLVEAVGEATPYELKGMAARSVGNFWSLQHTQFYLEPERLTRGGYLTRERERGGRRRKRYGITERGRDALERWRAEPTGDLAELRDLGLLKLFFGADPGELAAARLEAHRAKLAEYEEVHRSPRLQELKGPRLALEAGIGHQREWIRFWERLAE